MKRAAQAILATAFISFTVAGCAYPIGSHTPTPTPNLVLSGTYSGNVAIISTTTYSDGTPSSVTSRVVSTQLVYNSASTLTQFNRVLPDGTIIAVPNPQVGTTVTYPDTVAGVTGTVTATVTQASYSPLSSTIGRTATFAGGSTGYTGTGSSVITVQAVSGGASYSIVRIWTITPPGGTPVITASETGSAVLPKS